MECMIRDLSIYYEEYGQGKPILCLHGYSVDHRLMSGCLEPIFQNLDGYRRIYLDLPGMGKTLTKPWITNADIMLEVLIEFTKKVMPNESFLLIGESYGGYLSLGIIHQLQKKLDGVLLLCSCIKADFAQRTLPPKSDILLGENLPSEIPPMDLESFMDEAVVATNETWKRFRDEILPGLKAADQNFLTQYQQHGYSFSFETELKNNIFDKPVCILAGRQDHGVGYEDAWGLLDNFPRATFSVFDCAGHNLQIEREELFSMHVKDWINRIAVLSKSITDKI